MQLSTETNPMAAVSGPTKSRPFWVRHTVLVLFVVALLVRIVLAILVTSRFSGSLVLDDATYWDLARAVANDETHLWDPFESGLYSSTRTFSMPLAAIYDLFGPSKLAGQVLVAIVGALAAVVVFALARNCLEPRIALVPALIVAFLPSQVVWSSLVLKDAFVWTTLALIALCFLNAAKSERLAPLLIWLALVWGSVLALAYLRPHSLVVACLALALSSWIGVHQFRWLRVGALVTLFVVMPWLRGFGPGGEVLIRNAETITAIQEANAVGANTAIVDPKQVLSLETESTDLPPKVQAIVKEIDELKQEQGVLAAEIETLDTQLEQLPQGAREERLREKRDQLAVQVTEVGGQITSRESVAQAILQEEYDPSRAVGVKHVVRGLSVMLAEPYPWDVATGPSFRMAQAETIVWYPILFLAILGLLPALRSRTVMLFPLLVGGGTLLVYALAEGNVGTAFRHRSEFIWVVALLAGFGAQQATRRLQERHSSAPDLGGQLDLLKG